MCLDEILGGKLGANDRTGTIGGGVGTVQIGPDTVRMVLLVWARAGRSSGRVAAATAQASVARREGMSERLPGWLTWPDCDARRDRGPLCRFEDGATKQPRFGLGTVFVLVNPDPALRELQAIA